MTLHAHARETVRLPLVLHVAQRDGGSVARPEFIADQLARARALYAPLGIELVVVGERKLAQSHAELVERSDRDALGTALQPGAINCFIVARLMDVDEPGRERRGVHWRVREDHRRHFVIVSTRADEERGAGTFQPSYVLAHELGHYFGNQEHSDVPGNLMSYQHTDSVPVLDESQQRRVHETVIRLLDAGELRAVTEGAAKKTK